MSIRLFLEQSKEESQNTPFLQISCKQTARVEKGDCTIASFGKTTAELTLTREPAWQCSHNYLLNAAVSAEPASAGTQELREQAQETQLLAT